MDLFLRLDYVGFSLQTYWLSLDLCAWMLGRLKAKIHKTLEVGCKDDWLVGSQDPQCPMFSLSMAKSLRVRLACLLKGQASTVRFGLGRANL